MKLGKKGFTLIELLIVITMFAILAAVALPQFADWRDNATYKEATRTIVSGLREVRSRAIAANLQHKIEFKFAPEDASDNTLQIYGGDRPYNSAAWVSFAEVELPDRVLLKKGTACSETTGATLSFFPNGTADAVPNLCVFDLDGNRRFVVHMNGSGRVVVDNSL